MSESATNYPVVDPDLNARVGLTPWVLASEQPPPQDGWYKTRRKSAPNFLQPQRRFWTAASIKTRAGYFSRPVFLGDSEEDASDASVTPASFDNSDIEWCGLLAPHPQHDFQGADRV